MEPPGWRLFFDFFDAKKIPGKFFDALDGKHLSGFARRKKKNNSLGKFFLDSIQLYGYKVDMKSGTRGFAQRQEGEKR